MYVNFNERDAGDEPQSSYHASGQLHHKGRNHYLFPIRKQQKPNKDFKGSESIITTSIRQGDGRAWNVICKPEDYLEIMIIPDEIVTPEFGFQFNVEIVQPGSKAWVSTYPYAKIIQQQIFNYNIPWIVASLYEVNESSIL